ncbi:MAG: YihY/virulence factor BrkB family protein [Paludibacteraceae bacterium]|nr:YihY/virulence factor BrkB family protein [Paludibacteraceae bacterium]
MKLWQHIIHFFSYDLWRQTSKELSRWQRIGYLILRSIVLTIRGFLSHDINTRANAMTYSMMFAIVPILSLVLAIAKGFGFEQLIEKRLYDSVLGQMGLAPTIMGFVQRYLETAQGGVFIGVGIIILLWSVYSFFNTIEGAFNKIWQVKKSRSILRQATTYITILLLIPTLIVVSSGLSIFLQSATANLQFEAMTPVKEFFIRLTPFIMCWIIFTWMFWAIPNTKVGIWSALIPGISVGTLFQLLQMLSFYVMTFLSRTSIIYGAFAAIPLLLTWLQLTCLFILSGAELSFAIECNEDFDYERDLQHISRRYKDTITLFLCYLVIQRFAKGQPAITAQQITDEHHLPMRLVNQLLGRLTEIGILCEVFSEDEEQKAYLPSMDIHQLSIGHILERIDNQGNKLFLNNTSKTFEQFCHYYDQLLETHADTRQTLLLNFQPTEATEPNGDITAWDQQPSQ